MKEKLKECVREIRKITKKDIDKVCLSLKKYLEGKGASFYFQIFEYLSEFEVEAVKNLKTNYIKVFQESLKKISFAVKEIEKCITFYYLENAVNEDKKLIYNFIEGHIFYKQSSIERAIDDFLVDVIEFLDRLKKGQIYSFNFPDINKKPLKEIEDKINLTIESLSENIKTGRFTSVAGEYHNLIKLILVYLSELTTIALMEYMDKANHDILTGALSRRTLESIYKNILELSLLSNTSFAVVFIDIDNFKEINDTFGHLIGDELLKEIVNAVKSKIRKTDYFIRYGGDEFIALFPSISEKDLSKILSEISSAIKNTKIKHEDQIISTTASIGGVLIKKQKNLQEVIDLADKLMYEVKKSGKGKIKIAKANL